MQPFLSTEDVDKNFQQFSRELLAAEEEGFRGDAPFYSPEALSKILERFCDIIAKNLHAQSCTVQLKLHDIATSPHFRHLFETEGVTPPPPKVAANSNLRKIWGLFCDDFRSRLKNALGGSATAYRRELLRDPLSFPYAIYPKGAVWLVASNKESPWAACAGWLVTELSRGVTAQIVQDKSARVRDRMSIQQTRQYRKFGGFDPYVWTNQKSETPSPRYFFNYYGVPIRIHQGGDVIGILRVENKGLGTSTPVVHKALNDILSVPLKSFSSPGHLVKTLHTKFRRANAQIKKTGVLRPSQGSLLSLAYLAFDLTSVQNYADYTIGKLCTESYDEPHPDQTPTIRKDTPPTPPLNSGRPPVQLTFDTLGEEFSFLAWLSESASSYKGRIDSLDTAVVFYETLNGLLRRSASEALDDDIRLALVEATRQVRGETQSSDSESLTVTIENPINGPRPLLRNILLSTKSGHRFSFHIQVTPSLEEMTTGQILEQYYQLDARNDRHLADHYRAVNDGGFPAKRNDWEIHIPTDRLASRIQALTFAFPIPEFSLTDSWWLSWAALEIGKLIERQISYRGTSLNPTVPLTTMDFYRVPISDMSFVDSLRTQHADAEAVLGMLKYHIPNHCRELKLDTKLEYSHRIKDFRSYLERLGQEHRALFDALVSVWLYVLHSSLQQKHADRLGSVPPRDLTPDGAPAPFSAGLAPLLTSADDHRSKHDQVIALNSTISTFCHHLKEVCGPTLQFSDEEISWLRTHRHTTLGDLTFSAPHFPIPEGELHRALRLLQKNLRDSPQMPSTVPDVPGVPFSGDELADCVLRRYDPFAGAAISYYVYLSNLATPSIEPETYKRFYKTCKQLVNYLADKYHSSHEILEQQHELSTELTATKKLFTALERIRAQVLALSTTDYCSVMVDDSNGFGAGKDNAHLTIRGIYKRIRTLVNIGTNQMSPRHLNWEASRFDYVGTRVTCLFKNQVFAIYEQLWNRGDPFLCWGRNGIPQDVCLCLKDDVSRQRWLSIRTKIHDGEGGYNAWQISALMDPGAISKGHWSSGSYNLRSLRNFLSISFDAWHPIEASAYLSKAQTRSVWQRQYCEWFPYVSQLVRGEKPTACEDDLARFPEYPLRTPLDIVVRVLFAHRPMNLGIQPQNVSAACAEVAACLLCFSEVVSVNPEDPQLVVLAKQIYSLAGDLAGGDYADKTLCLSLRGQLAALEAESHTCCNLGELWKITKAFKTNAVLAALAELRAVCGQMPAAGDVSMALLMAVRRIQSMQKHFLFDLERVRDEHNVLERILAYVLLFDPDVGSMRCGEGRQQFGSWSAYDLFYYIMSLVPIEIQVRTALADTVAEQYHGIYKATVDPAASDSVQCWRTEEIGRELDQLARELDGQFEAIVMRRTRDGANQNTHSGGINNE